jgi:hypothetical protein
MERGRLEDPQQTAQEEEVPFGHKREGVHQEEVGRALGPHVELRLCDGRNGGRSQVEDNGDRRRVQ